MTTKWKDFIFFFDSRVFWIFGNCWIEMKWLWLENFMKRMHPGEMSLGIAVSCNSRLCGALRIWHSFLWTSYCVQYLKHIRVRHQPIFELFPVMIGTTITWAYAHLLTMSGAYEHATSKGKNHCRTDRAHIIGTTPWYLLLPFFYLNFQHVYLWRGFSGEFVYVYGFFFTI